MADTPKRPVGRPSLKAGEASMTCSVRLPVSDYDRVWTAAQKHRISVADVVRAALRVAFKQQQRLDE